VRILGKARVVRRLQREHAVAAVEQTMTPERILE
jgi:hypothetical protein